jgi:hypothetical protein
MCWVKKKGNQGNKLAQITVGYVLMQITNVSLEEAELKKHTYVGTASYVCGEGWEDLPVQCACMVQEQKGNKGNPSAFEECLNGKLKYLPTGDRNKLKQILREYQHLFFREGNSTLGCATQVKHTIGTGDARPIKANPYRISHSMKPMVECHIENMLKNGIIEPSMSPWSSSIVLVPKKTKDGSVKYRFCVEYRASNAVTKPDAYSVPNIVVTSDSLGNSKIFFVLDIASGHHHIEVKPEEREKTAFSCPKGHYQFTEMPFGLNNAPAMYQCCMDCILTGLKGTGCLAYLDELICYSTTMDEYVCKYKRIFERLEEAGFKIQPDKFVFASDSLEYLGHTVTKDGVKPDPKKILASSDYPVPTTLRDIRSFIGLASYYRRHVPNFTEVAKPLNGLMRKEVLLNGLESSKQRLIN